MARDNTVGKSRANRNRAIRQEEMRAQLAAQGHIQHVSNLIDKIMDDDKPIDDSTVRRYNTAINASMRLVDKYLPDLKNVEHTGGVGSGLSDLLEQAQSLREQQVQGQQEENQGDTTTTH